MVEPVPTSFMEGMEMMNYMVEQVPINFMEELVMTIYMEIAVTII